MATITINQRFRDLIPPLAPEEMAQLEANLIADGCRDPLVTWRGILIDGHNRYEICRRHQLPFTTKPMQFADEDAACVWIIRNQFGRRNLAPLVRVELVEKLSGFESRQGQRTSPENSGKAKRPSERRAETAGVNDDTYRAGKLILDAEKNGKVDAETMQKLRQGKAHVHRVAKEIKETRAKEARQEKRLEAAKDAPADERVIVGDFREHAGLVADGSLSLIFTDPPYNREASKMLPALAEFAALKLADGGSLICYVGQTQLPAAIDAFRLHLRYWWAIACVHSGRATVMREYGVNAGWKAVLWFVKGTRDDNGIMVNDVMSGGQEKAHHDWQQAESEAAYWIEKLCPADGLVCDPFLGGGTTAAAAEALGRKWVGFEIDKDNAAIARKRVAA